MLLLLLRCRAAALRGARPRRSLVAAHPPVCGVCTGSDSLSSAVAMPATSAGVSPCSGGRRAVHGCTVPLDPVHGRIHAWRGCPRIEAHACRLMGTSSYPAAVRCLGGPAPAPKAHCHCQCACAERALAAGVGVVRTLARMSTSIAAACSGEKSSSRTCSRQARWQPRRATASAMPVPCARTFSASSACCLDSVFPSMRSCRTCRRRSRRCRCPPPVHGTAEGCRSVDLAPPSWAERPGARWAVCRDGILQTGAWRAPGHRCAACYFHSAAPTAAWLRLRPRRRGGSATRSISAGLHRPRSFVHE